MSRTLTRRQLLQVIALSSGVFYLGTRGFTAAPNLARGVMPPYMPLDDRIQLGVQNFLGDEPWAHKYFWNLDEVLASRKPPAKVERVPLAVVGGGISGLFSAYLLKDFDPVIFEQSSRFGGYSKGEIWNGIPYSMGAAYTGLPVRGSPREALFRELDLLEPHLLAIQDSQTVLKDGRLLEGIWQTPAMEKLRQYFLDTVHERQGLRYPDLPYSDGPLPAFVSELDQEDFYSHLQRWARKNLNAPLPEEALALIENYCWSTYGGSITEVSAAAGLCFYAAEFENLAVYPGGNAFVAQRLTERLSQKLSADRLRPQHAVLRVTEQDRGVRLTYVRQDGEFGWLDCDVAILACPKFAVKHMVPNLPDDRLAAFSQLNYRGFLVANVLLKASIAPRFYDLYSIKSPFRFNEPLMERFERYGATDVVLGSYHSYPGIKSQSSVLTLYRALPFDGGRKQILPNDTYSRWRQDFENQIGREVLPALGLTSDAVQDLRLMRWGHAMPLPTPGTYATSNLNLLRQPLSERIFMVEQDNWMLPALETGLGEAFHFCAQARRRLES